MKEGVFFLAAVSFLSLLLYVALSFWPIIPMTDEPGYVGFTQKAIWSVIPSAVVVLTVMAVVKYLELAGGSANGDG